MPGIKARLEALTEAVESWKGKHETPYKELDPISQAMVDFVNELSALDEQGKQEYLERNPDMTIESLERMIKCYTLDW